MSSEMYYVRAQQIASTAEAEQRKLNPQEQAEAWRLLQQAKDEIGLEAKIQQMGQALGGPVEGGSAAGLYGAMMSAGFDRQRSPSVVVPFSTFQSTATFDGTYADAVPSFFGSPALGRDERFLYPLFPTVPVESDATSVSTFRQKTRTLPTLSDAIRDIAAVTTKPEVATAAELANEPLHQVALIESDVPNIMLESASFRSWINDDLAFGYRSALDFHCIAQMVAETVPSQAYGANLLETIVHAVEVVATAGYNPTVLAASPETLITLRLLQQPTIGGYIGTDMDFILSGLRKVAVNGLNAAAVAYVLDPSAAGTLYTSPVRVAAFEQDAGQTNSSTVRIESNSVFVVQRLGALCEIATGS